MTLVDLSLISGIAASSAIVVTTIWQLLKKKGKKVLPNTSSHPKWGRDVKGLERRWVTILVMDIRGFTKTVCDTKVSLGDVTTFITQFFGITYTAVEKDVNSGNAEINKFLGDGFLIFLSESERGIEHPSVRQAIKAAFSLIKNFRFLCNNPQYSNFKDLSLGIGIACGEIVYGPFGGPLSPLERGEITGIGEYVNLAFRLTSNAKENQILVSKEVWREINSEVDGVEMDLTLEGFGKTKCWEIRRFVEKEGE